MTYEDVLNRLRSSFYQQDMETTEYVSKLEEACEKQIEKKPKIDFPDIDYIEVLCCPSCGYTDECDFEDVYDVRANYCPMCGQKFLWD